MQVAAVSRAAARQGTRAVLFALAWAVAEPATLAAGLQSISIQGPACFEEHRTSAQIRRLLGATDIGCEELRIWLHTLPPTAEDPSSRRELSLLMLCGGRTFQRTVPFDPAHCAAFADTVALMAEAWLRTLWRVAPESPELGGHESPRQESAASPRLPVAGQADSPASASLAARPRQLWLGLAGGGFLPAGPGRTGAELAASAEWGLGERWGLAIAASRVLPVRARLEPGEISVSSSALYALGRMRLTSSSWAELDALGGAGLVLLAGRSSGYTVIWDRDVSELGFLAALRLRHALRPGLAVLGTAGVALQSRRHAFRVQSVGPALELPAARVTVSAGIGWSPF